MFLVPDLSTLLCIQAARDRTNLLVAGPGHVEKEADQEYGRRQNIQDCTTCRRRGGFAALLHRQLL